MRRRLSLTSAPAARAHPVACRRGVCPRGLQVFGVVVVLDDYRNPVQGPVVGTRSVLRDGVWVRLLDIKTALSARSYQPEGSVVIEVTDEFCPWNAGCWRISSARVERTGEAPGLRCDASGLGSVYLGGFTWTQLARALRVQELIPGAIARADTLFQPALPRSRCSISLSAFTARGVRGSM